MAAMRRGDWQTAWAVNDQVLRQSDPATRDDPSAPYHRRWVWDGRPFAGRHVLVRCYHGLGDTLQFARYLPALRRFAASVTVEAQAPLVPLLRGMMGADWVVPFVLDRPLPPAECDIEIMELPHALRLRPDEVAPVDFGVRPAPVSGIGICWRSSSGWDPARNVPEELLGRLARGAVALQPGPVALPVRNQGGAPVRLTDTAALIAGLDLVITIDTMVAHLAGCLGRPTLLLLKHQADWRWMDGRRDSPWYPTMRLFRQPSPGDWASVVAEVSEVIAAAGEPGSHPRSRQPSDRRAGVAAAG